MFCTRCGTANAPEARYCMKCGGAVSGSLPRPALTRPGLITAIAVLHFIFDPLIILGGLAFIFGIESKPEERPFEIVFGAILLLVGIVALAAAVGLWQRKPYGRNIQIGLSIVGLLGFPMGTIVNGLILWYLFTPPVKVLYSGKTSSQLTQEEIVALQQPGGGGAPVAVVLIIGFFAVIGIIGILAAIAIPNLLTAMQRSKQKRTMADMRTIDTSIRRYAADTNTYPAARDLEGVKGVIREAGLITLDGWAQPIRYGTDGANYWLISAGKDGQFQTENPREYPSGETTNFDCDIVFVNGEFVQYPEGARP